MKSIQLNLPQLYMKASTQPDKFWEGGRGVGKTTLIADRFIEICTKMPRSTNSISGKTFTQILTRTLPSLRRGLEMFGWKEGIHYFIGKKPPAKYKWDLAYEAPASSEYFIYTFTGAGFHLVSMSNNNGRGLNVDSNISDEASTYEFEQFQANVLSTKRGNISRFGHIPIHHSVFCAFNIPISKAGEWVYRYEQRAKTNPSEVFYLRSSSHFNRDNLGDKFFKEQREILTPLLYSMEIDNVRPIRLEGGFYPTFSDSNLYSQVHNEILSNAGYDFSKLSIKSSLLDGDCDSSQKLDIALDYGANINCLVVGQYNYRSSDYTKEYQVLKSQYVLWPKTLEDVVQEFCDYYQSHRNRHINYYFDQTANGRKGDNSLKFKDTVIKILTDNKWIVNAIYVNEAPGHHSKHLYFNRLFKGDPKLPFVKFNETNAASVIVSIGNAGVKEGRNGFEKDKSPERSTTIPDQETTHLSDAVDTLLYHKFIQNISDKGDFI